MSEPRVLRGSDAMELLLDIRLDGIMTGYSSAILHLLGDRPGAEEIADKLAGQAMAEITADPLVMEAFRSQIAERLAGVDSGPITMGVHRV